MYSTTRSLPSRRQANFRIADGRLTEVARGGRGFASTLGRPSANECYRLFPIPKSARV